MQKGTLNMCDVICYEIAGHSAVAQALKHIHICVDIAELHISDIGEFKLHEEGKLMDFDITVIPEGGIYKYVHRARTLRCINANRGNCP